MGAFNYSVANSSLIYAINVSRYVRTEGSPTSEY